MNDKKQAKTRNTNNPDVLDTDKESIFDKHEDMKTVDQFINYKKRNEW